MPVQFVCEHCHKTLKVGRRKIGEEVACPKCGGTLTVPPEEEAAVAVAMAALEKSQGREPEPTIPEFAVFDYDPPAASGISRRRTAPAAAPPTAPVALVALVPAPGRIPAAAAPPAAPSPAAAPMLLISRTTLYAQAVLFLVVALGAFGAGYLIGYGTSPGPAAVEAEAQPVVVQGTLFYHDDSGRRIEDHGAAILALPRGDHPEAKLSAKGLNPRNAEPAAGDAALLALEEIGAAYTRADERGEYLLSVPRPGSYYLLCISNGPPRPEAEGVAQADLAELRKYFEYVPDLLGRGRYDLTTVELAAGQGIVTHSRGFVPGE